MNPTNNAPRLLGATFLFVVFASLTAGMLFMSVTGSGSTADILVNTANNPLLMRSSILFEMINSSGIIVLASLLYSVLSRQHRIIALIALGLWLAEAIVLALGNMGALALIALSREFVQAGAPQQSFYQTLGAFLYQGMHGHGATLHMWFYCTGGVLWYYLFYQARYIPRAISLFGLLAVCVALLGIIVEFFGYAVPIFVYLPILPFELAIGSWLLFRGIADGSQAQQHFMHANEPI